ncbi:response regulator [Lederbergia lenta]|uniref:response regulator n=1 Tax=Lederbergia lenta TaxID=1467 RepID=UPI0020414F96|nr:response regulator [Lederbergia lenta]MCM3112177.1 response regulator [Lederbergia lenta]
MFNLLIVDDEPFIVDGLAALDWNNVNIDQVYKATSGKTALQIMAQKKVDIIITDIKMPDMTGIEFIRKLGLGRKSKTIFLSGYAEFEYAKQALKLEVFDYLLKPVTDDELYDAVLRAGKALSQEQIKVNSYEEVMTAFMPISEHVGEVKPFYCLYENPQLIHLLDGGRWNTVEEKLNNIFSQLHLNNYHSNEFVMQTYFMISNSFIYFAHKNGQLLIDIIGRNFGNMFHAAQSGDIRRLSSLTFEALGIIKKDIKKEDHTHHKSVIEQVQEYVKQNLGSDVSLQSVSEHVYLHPAYLSKVYKAETGEGFSEYLNNQKMERAAYLLKETKEKVYEISVSLGYNDPSYFIKRFKNHYGVTPQEYRIN